MERAYKFRIYPTKKQEELILKTFGCARYVYNYYLNKRIEKYKESKENFNFYACSKDLTNLKKELTWLKEPDKCSLQNSLKDLEAAYKNFFSKPENGFPKFKSKKNRNQSYKSNCSNNNIAFINNKIKLPKLGLIKTKDKQIPQGRILNATVSKTPSGKYYVSICCTDVIIHPLEKTNRNIGIDLGLKEFAITSEGIKYNNPKFLRKHLKKLKRLQRNLSRKTKGGSNWNKNRIQIAKLYERITNLRTDYLNKLSTELIRNYDIICLETLQVKNMIKNHNLALSISDVSWTEFVRKLEYKAKWYDKTIIKIDRFYPSSQSCSNCGYINKEIKNLTIRKWICPKCKTKHDRDINAAKNILKEGLSILAQEKAT